MKTLTQIRNEVARELGYGSFEKYIDELFRAGSVYTFERTTKLTDEVARRACREALKNASGNATYFLDTNDEVHLVKSSITSEENIPKI